MRIKKIISAFKKGNNEAGINNPHYLSFLYAKFKYNISINEWYENKLYVDPKSNKDYYDKTVKGSRKWNTVIKRMNIKKSKKDLIFCYLDFLICKILYPGIDADDYFSYEFYNFTHNKRKTFITEGELYKIDRLYNGTDYEKIKKLDDKNIFNNIYKKEMKRDFFLIKDVDEKRFVDFLRKKKEIIVKPLFGHMGMGIIKKTYKNIDDAAKFYKTIKNNDYIIEEVIKQNKDIASINPSSINTIRIYSIKDRNNSVHIISSFLRIGRKGMCIDNYSAGGMACEIDSNTGIVITKATDKYGGSYYKHPDTGKTIIGFEIPCWKEAIKLVIKSHNKLDYLRYVAWDVCINNENEVVLIEGNTYGAVNLQQIQRLNGLRETYYRYM